MMSNGGMISQQNVNRIMEEVPWGVELSSRGGGGGLEDCYPVGTSFDFPMPVSFYRNSSSLPDLHPYDAELPSTNYGNTEDLRMNTQHLPMTYNEIYAAVPYQNVISMHIQPVVPPPFSPNFPGLFTLDRQELQAVNNITLLKEISTCEQRSKSLSTSDARKICCNCKKTGCLKLYCECFKADMYCSKETCTCDSCYNTTDYEDTVEIAREQKLSHKTLATESKSDDYSQDMNNKTYKSVSVRSEKGCRCSKSKCSNKHCECYKADKGCSKDCRCENCKNYHGVKPGNESAHLPDSVAFHPRQNVLADFD